MIPRNIIVIKAPNSVTEMRRIRALHLTVGVIIIKIPKIFKIIVVKLNVAFIPEFMPVAYVFGISTELSGDG